MVAAVARRLLARSSACCASHRKNAMNACAATFDMINNNNNNNNNNNIPSPRDDTIQNNKTCVQQHQQQHQHTPLSCFLSFCRLIRVLVPRTSYSELKISPLLSSLASSRSLYRYRGRERLIIELALPLSALDLSFGRLSRLQNLAAGRPTHDFFPRKRCGTNFIAKNRDKIRDIKHQADEKDHASCRYLLLLFNARFVPAAPDPMRASFLQPLNNYHPDFPSYHLHRYR
jgi:hypothetical protein